MCRLFLIPIFSVFISFNVFAPPEDEADSKAEAFNPASCHGTTTANSECGKRVGEKGSPVMTPAQTANSECNPGTQVGTNCNEALDPAVNYPTQGDLYFPKGQTSASQTPSSTQGGPKGCDEGLNGANGVGAVSCCSDPTTCLGGEGLSTLDDVNNIVTKVGPGLGMALQGFGKDMYGLCQAMQGLAAGGAALSMAAKTKCSGAISSCVSVCNKDITTKCEPYNTWKNNCLANSDNNTPNVSDDDLDKLPSSNPSVSAAGTAAKLIDKYTNNRTLCEAQRANTKDLAENAGEMANSAISAELCKQQAKMANNQAECKALGGTWENLECKILEPEEEREEVVSLRGSDGSFIPQQAGSQMGIGSESPSTNSRDEIPDPDDSNTQLGGGGNPDSPLGGESPLSPLGVASVDTDSDSDSSTGANLGKKGGSRSGLAGLGGGGSYNPYKRDKTDAEEEEKDNSLSMGGGGFAGYGGGGGFGDSGNSYAALKLNKKKLDELKKKKGAQRVTASDATGAHQNIFERISKRFQSLCQSKLDCR